MNDKNIGKNPKTQGILSGRWTAVARGYKQSVIDRWCVDVNIIIILGLNGPYFSLLQAFLGKDTQW